jgi:hypothetical protein
MKRAESKEPGHRLTCLRRETLNGPRGENPD